MIRRFTLFALTLCFCFAIATLLSSPHATAQTVFPDTWVEQYWNNPTFEGDPVFESSRLHSLQTLNHEWANAAPYDFLNAGIDSDNFTARYEQQFEVEAHSIYRVEALADDSAEVLIDGVPVLATSAPWQEATTTVELKPGIHTITVNYWEQSHYSRLRVAYDFVELAGPPSGGDRQWRADYFNNTTLSGEPVATRTYDRLDFRWADSPPAQGVQDDFFSARFTTSVNLSENRRIEYTMSGDDHMRLLIDGELVLDNPDPWSTKTVEVDLTPGVHTITVEYVEYAGFAYATLSSRNIKDTPPAEPTLNFFELDRDSADFTETITLSWEVANAQNVVITPRESPNDSRYTIRGAGSGTAAVEMAQFCGGDPTQPIEFALYVDDPANTFLWLGTITIETPSFDWFFDAPNIQQPATNPCRPATTNFTVEQQFSGGTMIWNAALNGIYVLFDEPQPIDGNQEWRFFASAQLENRPEITDPSVVAPDGFFKPVHGFGKVWFANEDIQERLGWATSPEQAHTATMQDTINFRGSEPASALHLTALDGQLWAIQTNGRHQANTWQKTAFTNVP